MGAYHYVNKPFNLDEVMLLVEKALETSQLRREVRALRSSQGKDFGFSSIIGDSAAMKTAKALMARVAASPASTVLLTGETGTGKDLAAKAIHYNSGRVAKQFVNITCSALPEQLLESELFGHERGAFTDARQQKRGLFETADGGTLFLDEIGEMTLALQSKLLRFLEEKAFKRVGGLSDVTVDVRVIAATNRDLEEEVKAGKFREDLFYRLQVMPIMLPPLRARHGDVPLLAAFFIDRFNSEFRKKVRGAVAGGDADAGAVRLARQRARAAQRHRAGDAAGRWRAAGGVRPDDADPNGVPGAVQAAARRGEHRRGGASAAGAGARALQGEPDPGGPIAGHQPRSGALPHREVRPAEGLTGPSGAEGFSRAVGKLPRRPLSVSAKFSQFRTGPRRHGLCLLCRHGARTCPPPRAGG